LENLATSQALPTKKTTQKIGKDKVEEAQDLTLPTPPPCSNTKVTEQSEIEDGDAGMDLDKK
jgi:hypothetical protein